MNDFIIEIIVRARRQIGDVMERAAREVDKLTRAEEKQVQTERKVAAATNTTKKSIDDLTKSYDAYLKKLEQSSDDVEVEITQLKRFGSEFEKLSRRAPAGSRAAEESLKLARAARQTAEEIIKARKEQQKQVEEAYKQAQQIDQAYADLDRTRAESAKKAAEEERRGRANRQAFLRELLQAVNEDEERRARERVEIARAEQADFERVQEARLASRADADRKIAEVEQAVAKQSQAIEKARLKAVKDLDAAQERSADAQRKALADTIAARGRDRLATLEQEHAQRNLRQEIEDTVRAYDDFIDRIRLGQVSGEQVRIGLQQQAAALGGRARQAARSFGPSSPDALFVGVRENEARTLIRDLGREEESTQRKTIRLTGALGNLFRVDPDKMNRMQEAIDAMDSTLSRASFSAVHFAGVLRSLVYVGVIVFFQELVSAAVALGGALAAVASTAVQAGGALAGALAAGAAQAIPVIGLLGAAWGRVGAVFKAVQQNIKQQLQATKDSTDATNRQSDAAQRVADAQDRVRDAQDRLGDSHQRLSDAQDDLNRALDEGRRQWEDLIAAERSAELQAERSLLSQRDAQQALREALRTGDVASAADLSLRVREAGADVDSSRINLRRAREDAAEARRLGPRGQPVVVAARRQVRDARGGIEDAAQGVQRARQDLRDARREADEAVQKVSAADQTLKNLLADLSPAERELYQVLNRVVTRYRQVFTGPGGVIESITKAFTFGGRRALDLLNDDRLIGAARRLSDGIADELRKGFRFLSSDSQRDFIVVMADSARRNLPLITELGKQVALIAENIARAGGPALTRFLDFLTTLATNAATATGSESGLARLQDFFLKGEEYAEDIFHLVAALTDLFAALVGAGAEEGQNAIQAITDSVREATEWVQDNKDDVRQFFADAIRATGAIARALGALTRELFSLFSADRTATLARAFERTFIPAITDVLRVLGTLVNLFLKLAGTGAGSVIFQFIIVMGGLSKTIGPIIGLFVRFGRAIAVIFGLQRTFGIFNTLLGLLGPIGLAIGAIGAALVLLNGKFHFITAFKNLFVSAQERAKEAADKATDAINRQIEALRRQRDAELARRGSQLAVQRAEIALQRARQDAARIDDQIAKGELKGRDADLARRESRLAVRQAVLDLKQAHIDLGDARKNERDEEGKSIKQSVDTVKSIKGSVDALKDERSFLEERKTRLEEDIDRQKRAADAAVDGSVQQQNALQQVREDEILLAQTNDDLKRNQKDLRTEVDRGRDAYRRWRRAVRDAGKNTETFGDVVHNTMEDVVDDVNQVLGEFGAKKIQWHHRRRRGQVAGPEVPFGVDDPGGISGFPGRQEGGFAVPGRGTGDSVYMQAKVEPGEKVFVLNRMASKALDGLQWLNRMVPRFQRGGEIQWNGHPRNVNSSVVAMLHKIFARWPDLLVTSTTDHSLRTTSGNISDHSVGAAVDLASGDYGYMNRVAEWIKTSGLYRSLKQGIHNPNLAVNAGQLMRPPGIFAGAVWAQHANHIHLAITGAIGRLLGSIARQVISGPSGRLTDALRGISRRVVRAANRFVGRQMTSTAPDEDLAGLPAGGSGMALMRSIARQRGWSFSDWWAIDAIETSHGRNLSNPTSTARLRGQFLDFNWGKYGPGSDPRQNPSMAQQIVAMARYIAERYGDPSRALAFHRAHNYYDVGGEVPGRVGQAVPILAHAKEWVLNQVQQSRVAGWLGITRAALKQALGFSGGPVGFQGGGEVGPYEIPSSLGTGTDAILREADRARRITARLSSRLINKKFTDALSRSFEAIAGDQGLFALLTQAVTDLTTRLDVSLKRATFQATKTGDVIKRLSDEQVAARAFDDLRRVYEALGGQQRAIQRELGDVARRLRSGDLDDTERAYLRGVRQNLRQRLADVRSAIADNLESQFNAIEQVIQSQVDAAQGQFERSTAGLDLQQRMRAVLGATAAGAVGIGTPLQIQQARAAALQAQQGDLASAARTARGAGHVDTALVIEAQMRDITVQIAEAIAQGIRDNVSEIEASATRGQARIDLAGRAADLRERIGDFVGAFRQRGTNLSNQGSLLAGTRRALEDQFAIAQEFGQTGVAEELSDKIAELTQQIDENTVAIAENTTAARAAAITAITQRGSFLGNVFSGAGGIVSALGELTGFTDTGRAQRAIRQSGNVLQSVGQDLRQQLRDIFGIDLRGLRPEQVADTLLGIDYDAVESGMRADERAQFEGLINAIIENTTATVQNSKQLQDITSPQAQSFSSTAWQMFRIAIFNGAGGLLPQFGVNVPSLAGGADVLRSGLVYAHSGEKIVAADVARHAPGAGYPVAEQINLNVTSPTEKLDGTDAGRQLAFYLKYGHNMPESSPNGN